MGYQVVFYFVVVLFSFCINALMMIDVISMKENSRK
ncbi:hypothetical protein Xsto_02491 [Xenorhabdus stockiae]|uniref:Uncharacterized protein n=1 Tax=Xenorhabdus stockiae TaxID=351614 RepID=A0A2D0KN60_9GAMM|nr:hypothetical protein Xsto_02491 [Xenorhabdus stockiae]